MSEGESVNVKVMVRVRPFSSREIKLSQKRKERLNCAVRMRGSTCVILEHTVDDQGFTIEKEREAFGFDNCFWSIPLEQETEASGNAFANQQDVYVESGKVALDAAFQGFNTCIFAYGQTGSGKTHSMLGCDSDPGVSPRLVDELFERIAKVPPGTKTKVECMFFEIYNEKVRDLFADRKKRNQDYEPPRIRQHPTKGVFVEGLKRHDVTDAKTTKDHMEDGTNERSVAATKMNATSSRSHAVFQIQLTMMNALKGTQTVATINLVDLAGSEKVKQSEVTGDSFNEARNINQSLSTLRRVIDTLIENSERKGRPKPPPFRESVLTYLLSDSLGGNSKTMMISAISPHESNIEDTLNTLRYAQRAKAIVCNAKVNEERNAEMMDAMKDELLELRRKLASGEPIDGAGYGGGGGGGGEMTEEIKQQIEERESELKRMEEQNVEMERAKAEVEEKLQEAAATVSTQKRERFAAAFRNAFLIAQDKKRIEASTKELDEARRNAQRLENAVADARRQVEEKELAMQQLEDKSKADAEMAARERAMAAEENAMLSRSNRGLLDDKAALQKRIDEMGGAISRMDEVKQQTEVRLREMQDDMLAMSRKVEQIAAEKGAVVEKLEVEAREAAQTIDDLHRRKSKYKTECAAAVAEASGHRRAAEEVNKDREQLLATVKAQQQLLNERSSLIDQLYDQMREHDVTAAKAVERADGKAEEVRILMESLREYENAAGKWMAEHTQQERELQQLRMYADGNRALRPSTAGTPTHRPTVSASPNSARNNVTPRRAQSPSASSIRSPFIRQPSIQQHGATPSTPGRARWSS